MTRLELARPFHDGLLALQLCEGGEPFPFAEFADALANACGGRITSRLDGLDELYWDIDVRGRTLTLHAQHDLGVFLCATNAESEEVLCNVLPFVERFCSRLKGPETAG